MKISVMLAALLVMAINVSSCTRSDGQPQKTVFRMVSGKIAEIPAGQDIGEAVFSPEGDSVAYLLTRDGRFAVGLNNKVSQFFEDARDPVLCRGGASHAFVARQNGKESVYLNGTPMAMYDSVGRLALNPDCRVVYEARKGEKWLIVAGIRESRPFDAGVTQPVTSPDGKRIAYIEQNNNKKSNLRICNFEMDQCINGKEYDSLSAIRSSADRSRLAYVAGRDGKKALVTVDLTQPGLTEKESVWYDDIPLFDVSSKGEQIAFLARRADRNVLSVRGVEQPVSAYDSAFDLIVADNGRTLYSAMVNNKVYAYLDGRQTGPGGNGVNAPVFSADGANYAYSLESGSREAVVVNGIQGPLFDKVVTPRFSPDGSRLLFRARNNGERFVVEMDSGGKVIREHPHYESVWDVNFAPDGRSVGYGARVGRELLWKVETFTK